MQEFWKQTFSQVIITTYKTLHKQNKLQLSHYIFDQHQEFVH